MFFLPENFREKNWRTPTVELGWQFVRDQRTVEFWRLLRSVAKSKGWMEGWGIHKYENINIKPPRQKLMEYDENKILEGPKILRVISNTFGGGNFPGC